MSIEVSEARSYVDGIDFRIAYQGKKTIISATRKSDGSMSIKFKEPHSMDNQNKTIRFLFAIISALFFTGFTVVSRSMNRVLASFTLVFFLWFIVIGYYFVSFMLRSNIPLFRYHATEHRVLNYVDSVGKLPYEISDLFLMKNISVRCGSNLIAAVLIIFSESYLCYTFFESIEAKVISIVISVISALLLWAFGFCNFLQVLTIRTPTYDELELAVTAMRKYAETIGENRKEML